MLIGMVAGRKRRWALALAVWVMLAAAAVVWGLGSEERDLTSRAHQALEAAGINAEVSFQGRDAVLSGVDPADRGAAAAVIEAIEGVRIVRFETGTAAVAVATTSQPLPTTPPTVTPTTLPTTTPITRPAPTTTIASPPTAHLVARLEQGTLHLSGSIPDTSIAAQLRAAAEQVYAPLVEDSLAVDTSLAGAPWLSNAAQAIWLLPASETVTLELAGTQATLSGKVANREQGALLDYGLRQLLGSDTTFSNQVIVTNREAPRFRAAASSDGTLVLDGLMPDQASVDRILVAATEVYGEAAVTNRMTVGTNLATPFALYRIPFTFSELASVSQWELGIEGEKVTASLRGAATLAPDSAALSPRLRGLLTVVADILTSKPTFDLTIEGHTDSSGTEESNQAISEARAKAAVDFLIGAGIEPERLSSVGFGETRPIAENATTAGRALNRRLDFTFTPRMHLNVPSDYPYSPGGAAS